MRIEFASAELPEAGTLAVLAPPGGPLGAARRRSTGAPRGRSRARCTGGRGLERGQANQLLYPAGLGLERLIVLALGKPDEAEPFDLEALGGSLSTG